MAYFPNGTSGLAYEERYCHRCANYGPADGPGCPIWGAHLLHSYDGATEKNVRSVLNILIPEDKDGFPEQCSMFRVDGRDHDTLPMFPE